MDSKLERLVKGDHAERAMILLDADSDTMKVIIQKIETCKRLKFTYDELNELKALNRAYEGVIRDLKSVDIPFNEKVRILREDGPDFIHKLLKPLRRHKRNRRNCPVKGCKSVALLQLHNHLKYVHRFNDEERKYWLTKARLDKLGVDYSSFILNHDVEGGSCVLHSNVTERCAEEGGKE